MHPVDVQFYPKLLLAELNILHATILFNYIPLIPLQKNRMKKLFLILTLLTSFFSVALFAQSTEDVVYLSNGSILRGKITEKVSGNHVTIEMVGRNIMVIPDSEIKMVLTDQFVPAKNRENNASPVEMAASVSFFGGSKNSAGCSFITSYRFPFRLSAGVGIGNEWFDRQQIPFIADVKYSFLKGSWSPYVYAQTGYAIPLSKKEEENNWYNTEYYGGVLAGAGAGMRFDFSGRNALIFSVGYRYQKTKTITDNGYWSSSYYQTETIKYDEYNRMTFSVGFLFN